MKKVKTEVLQCLRVGLTPYGTNENKTYTDVTTVYKIFPLFNPFDTEPMAKIAVKMSIMRVVKFMSSPANDFMS